MASRARNRWRGRVFLPSGSERTKLFDTKREALAWEAANRGRPVETNETLAAYIKRTRDQVLHGLSASTAATYRSHLVRRIEPELGHRKMAKIHTGHVETAAAEWSRSGVSSSVVVGTLNCLSRFYRHAMKSEALSVNPVQAAERPRPDPARTVPTLTAAEVDAVVARCAAVNGLYGDYVRLAASLGLRAGELTALRAGDVDLGLSVVTVRQAYSAGKLGPPKWGRSRQVLIVGEAREVLTRRLAGRRREVPVFLGEAGGRLYHSNFIQRVGWPKLVVELGLAGTHFHDLRATAIVGWIRAGLPLTTVRDMAGHASLTTTNIYARLARTDLADALKQLESYADRTQQGPPTGGRDDDPASDKAG